ncbi:UbiA prenyltransferase [Psychrobacter sp. JCM 18902]|uniref:decaprenyl-phosphate phosphoribosyltransferase n=1 Tax=Psychrobacter sp. JCM 18902 TaxID=1298607 RepID=UPI0004356127|nr:decaprenyl-phosphate phosphoribosyltransferase [Psychrobacter sp. JCM 18902]GAF57655.1 UbiA prenyltransferase [Psychrobacter sp. JCM 18902]
MCTINSQQSEDYKILNLIKLVRPRHWIKNIFIFAPLLFAGKLLNISSIYHAIVASAAFCVAASAVYVLNDLSDIEKDRKHPIKFQSRPLASGLVKPREAILLLISLYIILFFFWLYIPSVIYVILIYLLLNWAYTFKLKNEPVLEIFIVAFGFVLRVYTGALAISVPVSNWMFITTLSISLYLASIKRRQEILINQSNSRAVLAKYSIDLVNRFAEMSAIMAIIFYSLYVMAVQPDLVISIPLVIFGLFRYWYIVDMLALGESPTDALLHDIQLLLTILLWSMCCFWIIYS